MKKRLLRCALAGAAVGVSLAPTRPNDTVAAPDDLRHQSDDLRPTRPPLHPTADWRVAAPGLRYEFPRDHHAHPDFKTEWWYFTGNLTTENGRPLGFELTFFRQGIRPPNEREKSAARFIVDDLKFAHFAVTDAAGQRFLFYDKASRGSFGEAGFGETDRLAWIDDWILRMEPDGNFDLAARGSEAAIALHLIPQKRPVIHGDEGISRKAEGGGHASHYYSITRLTTSGTLHLAGKDLPVSGESWFDHEWATNQLAPGQAGWNWVSAQFDGGSELMLYQMRLKKGTIDPVSSGTVVAGDGTSFGLTSADFQMTPETFWKSDATRANYPVGWRVSVPRENLDFRIQPVLKNQELVFPPLIYWEGAFDLEGIRAGQPVRGRGYLELTGYASPLEELNR